MMKKPAIVLAVAAGLALGAIAYLRAPSSPPGQEPLLVLSSANFSQFENAFDAKADFPRLVVLLSPT